MAAFAMPVRLQDWAESLSVREKGLLLVALLAALTFLAETGLFHPQRQRAQALRQQLAAQGERITELRQAANAPAAPAAAAANHPPAAHSAQREALQQDVQYARMLLHKAGLEAGLGGMARSLIGQTGGVTLRGLQTRPTQPFLRPQALTPASGAQPAAPALPTLYLHAIDLTVEGTYDDVVRFLQRLEAQERPYFWPSLTVTVIAPSLVSLRATVQTLSTSPQVPLE